MNCHAKNDRKIKMCNVEALFVRTISQTRLEDIQVVVIFLRQFEMYDADILQMNK